MRSIILQYDHTRSYREVSTDIIVKDILFIQWHVKNALIFKRHFGKAPVYVICVLLLIKAPL